MVLLFLNGDEIPSEQAKSGELVVVDDEYRPKLGATVEVTTFKIDATKKPKAIDLLIQAASRKGNGQGYLQDRRRRLDDLPRLEPREGATDRIRRPGWFRAHAGGLEAIEDRRRDRG